MQQVKWGSFIGVCLLLAVLALSHKQPAQSAATAAPSATTALKVFVTRQSAEGVKNDDLTPAVADALGKHAAERIAAKTAAILAQSGTAAAAPPIGAESSILQVGSKRLVVSHIGVDCISRTVTG